MSERLLAVQQRSAPKVKDVVGDSHDGITPSELKAMFQKTLFCQKCHALRQNRAPPVRTELPSCSETQFAPLRLSSSCVAVHVVDALDLPSSFLPNLSRYVGAGKKKILVLNKVDLLPTEFSMSRLKNWIRATTEKAGESAWDGIFATSAEDGSGLWDLADSIASLRGPNSDVVLIGRPNVGKSRLITALHDLAGLRTSITAPTSSAIPGTTAGLLWFPISAMKPVFGQNIGNFDSGRLMDSPGLMDRSSFTALLSEEEISWASNFNRRLKLSKVDLEPGYSLFVGGLVQADVRGHGKVQMELFLGDRMQHYKCLTQNAGAKYNQHAGRSALMYPPIGKARVDSLPALTEAHVISSAKLPVRHGGMRFTDIAIAGIGWIALATLSSELWIHIKSLGGIGISERTRLTNIPLPLNK